jgi:hypothetical protein
MRNRVRAALIAVSALALASCGTGTGHDARQMVKEDPATVYKAFAGAFEEGAMGGASQYSNLWNGGFQIFVEKPSATKLDVVTKFDGETSSEVHFTFTPKDDGKATLVDADVAVNTAVMHNAFKDTPQQRLGDLPEAAFKLGMQRTMAKYAERIEAGMPLNSPGEGWQTAAASEPPPEFYEGMSAEDRAEIRRHDEEEKQESASAPMVDPDAAARNYLAGH